MRLAIVLLSLFGLLLAAPQPTPAQAPEPEPAAQAPTIEPAYSVQDPAQSATGGVPLGVGQPRTLRHYWHLFIAFSVIWLLLFGYALTIGSRFGRLEAEVRRLSASGTAT